VSPELLALLEAVKRLVRRFEGLRLRPYLCPAGVPTIGYGATTYEDGRRVKLTDPAIAPERAEALLTHQILRRFLPATQRLCPGADSSDRLAALVDFAFNLGEGQLAASTLRRKVNAQDWPAAREQHLRWNRAAGRVLPGLVARCQARAALT
jgi:lysozyme